MGNRIKQNLITMKVDENFRQFSERLNKNIVRSDGEFAYLYELPAYIVKFFKFDNNAYLNLIDFIVEEQKNDRP